MKFMVLGDPLKRIELLVNEGEGDLGRELELQVEVRGSRKKLKELGEPGGRRCNDGNEM